MFDPIDELVQRWHQNPSPTTTVALCEALREHPDGQLVQQVGEFAKARHSSDVSVMVSVARMYIEAGQFADAQTVLVAAGRQAPRDAVVYRWLGEVLLRRGDADRAEKVLERGIELGLRDREAGTWLERARSFRSLQASAGVGAVAAEIAHGMITSARGTIGNGPRSKSIQPLPRFNSDVDPDESATTEVFETVNTGDLEEYAPAAPPSEPDRTPLRKPLPAAGALPAPARAPRPQPKQTNAVPHPRDVLDALALAGVFEPKGATGGVVAWDHAARGPKRKGSASLITGMVLFLGATVGIYFAYRHKRAQDHLVAESLLGGIEAELHAGRVDQLPDLDTSLTRAFQLESRSPRAAVDWARDRALTGLLKGGADIAFEDAMARAKEVGVPEEQYSFARVASFLFQGDTAGAAAVLPRWEGASRAEPWFQLISGASLERAGDGRARERYATAVTLDPDLFVAKVGQARTAAIDGNVQESMRLAKALRSAFPDRAEPVALVALAWGRDPNRDDTPPQEANDVVSLEPSLPLGLKFIPHAITALRAIDRRTGADAAAEVLAGLGVAESPGAAVWLGTISLPIGDEALSRKAALAALQLSAAYEPARALAARVALIGGRIDEAVKATEDLDPTTPEVAMVRAASAYEKVDPDGLARALEALPAATRKLPFLTAIDLASEVLAGGTRLEGAKTLAMAADDAPWGDLVAMDIALDAGEISIAGAIAARWGKEGEAQPLRALRLARLARYEGRLEDADALSQVPLSRGTATVRALWERAYTLVARGRSADVGPLIARYPVVLGPVAAWLGAYATASGGGLEAARGRVATLDPPPPSSPFEARVVAASAFGALKDRRRGGDYVKQVLASGNLHPDLVAAALALGFHKVTHPRHAPTYE